MLEDNLFSHQTKLESTVSERAYSVTVQMYVIHTFKGTYTMYTFTIPGKAYSKVSK